MSWLTIRLKLSVKVITTPSQNKWVSGLLNNPDRYFSITARVPVNDRTCRNIVN